MITFFAFRPTQRGVEHSVGTGFVGKEVLVPIAHDHGVSHAMVLVAAIDALEKKLRDVAPNSKLIVDDFYLAGAREQAC